ncbi:MAG: phycobilisome linker polypeptide [Cyanobacteria bacterium P01_E01_bin.34]
MGITLAAGDDQFDVSLMGDVLPGSSDIKVEAAGNQTMKLAVGTSVSLDGDSAVAGTYSVAMALAPAAPRGWRLYLSKIGGTAAPTVASAASSTTKRDVDNRDKVFVIQYSGAMGPQVRMSVQTIRVSYERLSTEVARIARSGSKIVSIHEVA